MATLAWAWRVAAVCASSSQQGCLYAYLPTDVLDQDKTIPEQCQWFSLRVAKGWLTNDGREARREANRHRLESGSDFEQDVSSEDSAADPESPDEGAGAGDSWGVAGGGADGADHEELADQLRQHQHLQTQTLLSVGADGSGGQTGKVVAPAFTKAKKGRCAKRCRGGCTFC